jgi:hypothetical protein
VFYSITERREVVAAALDGASLSKKPVRTAGTLSGTVNFWTLPKQPASMSVVTTDRHLRYQQNLADRKIAIVVLDKARWKLIRRKLPEIAAAVASAKQGSFVLG